MIPELLRLTKQHFQQRPFRPHPFFRNGHAQTLAAYAWPRRIKLNQINDEQRLFTVADGVQVLAHCRWQKNRSSAPTAVIWHGMEGSSESVYMLAMALKAHAAGFNVIRVNLRNCGGSDHLTSTLYHGGLSEDLHAVVRELREKDRLNRIVLIGFSLGGNMVLKLAGEYGEQFPREVLAVAAVSPSIDLAASADEMDRRANWIYQQSFLNRLHKRIRMKQQRHPDLYDLSNLHLARSVREFDDMFTSRSHGFADANDYYYKASALRVVDRIRLPTLIIHAQDDPFIPFAPLASSQVSGNPNILLVAPKQGGHVAFLSARREALPLNGFGQSNPSQVPAIADRFWAENRTIEFSLLAAGQT